MVDLRRSIKFRNSTLRPSEFSLTDCRAVVELERKRSKIDSLERPEPIKVSDNATSTDDSDSN